MALHGFSTTARNAIVDALVDLVDAGTTDASGDIQFMTSGEGAQTCLIDHLSSQPPRVPGSGGMFDAAASGTAGLADTSIPLREDSCDGGTTAIVRFRDRDNSIVFKGTVTATGGGGDITFNTVTWTATDPVELTDFTVTMPIGSP